MTSTRLLIGSGFVLLLLAALLLVSPTRGRHGVAAPARALPVLSQVTGFGLTNQSGEPVTAASLRGRVWVGDLIFTRCPGPCVRMTTLMRQLQAALPADPAVRLVSLSADPQFDTPAVLARYASRFGADTNRWDFLTGGKQEIQRLATKDLLLVLAENQQETNASPEDLFLHSTRLVVVDREGRLRATFDGEDPASLPEVVAVVQSLLKQN